MKKIFVLRPAVESQIPLHIGSGCNQLAFATSLFFDFLTAHQRLQQTTTGG
jgi:hypothetical protein